MPTGLPVGQLNNLRLMRAENLGDGYDVNDILCYDIDWCYLKPLPMQCLQELVFAPTIKDVLVEYMDGMMSVLLSFCGFFENLTRHAAQHAQITTAWQ